MNCDDVQSAIYVYLDGEFAPPEEAAFRRHLDGCVRCRSLAGQEARFLDRLKETLDGPAVPGDLRARIEARLSEEPAPKRPDAPRGRLLSLPVPSRRAWLVLAPAALAALVLLGLAARQGVPAPGADSAVQHVVAAHTTVMPMEVRGSEEQIRTFLQENVPFAVKVPFQGQDGVKLVGARLTQLSGQLAVLYSFDWRGRRLSVLQSADTVAPTGRDARYRLGHHSGFGVVTYGQHGVSNAVVGDMPDGELRRLVPASYASY